MRKGIIVGLDPGTTTGIVILDVEGNILYSASKRNLKKSELIRTITNFGRPIIFATDVSPPPRSVEKLASAFGCTVFYPEKSFSVAEKQEMVKQFEGRLTGHEVDALAASFKAWKNYRKFFEKIKRILEDKSCPHLFEEVTIKLLKEGSENVESALEEITQKSREAPAQAVPDKRTEKLEIALREKEIEIKNLKDRIENLMYALEKRRLESKLAEKLQISLRRVEDYEKEIEELKNANKLLRTFERVRRKGLEPLIQLESISGLELEKLDKLIGLEGRVIYSNSVENISALNPFGIKAFLTESDKKIEIRKLEFPVVRIKAEDVNQVEGIKTVSEEFLENALKKIRKIGLVEWLEDYRKRKRNF